MAIDARIALMGQTPDYSQIPQTLLQTAAGIGQIQRQQQEAPLRQALFQAQVDEIPLQQAAMQQEQAYRAEQLDALRNDNKIKGGVYAAVQGRNLLSDPNAFISFAEERARNVSARGGDPSGTVKTIELVKSGDIEGARQLLDREINTGYELGILNPGDDNKTTEQRNLLSLGYMPGTKEYERKFNELYGKDDPEKMSAYERGQLELGRGRLALDQKKAAADAKGGGENAFKNAAELRKEFTAQSKDFGIQTDAIGRIQASAKDPSAAGDLALIFSYMKTLDPGSTVREGEFATAQNAGGVGDRAISAYNKVLSGQRLSPDQRKDFVSRAKSIYDQSAKQHEKRVGEYSRIATRNNIDPADVIVDFSAVEPTANGPVQIRSEAEYARLPSGSVYIDPTGKQRTKR